MGIRIVLAALCALLLSAAVSAALAGPPTGAKAGRPVPPRVLVKVEHGVTPGAFLEEVPGAEAILRRNGLREIRPAFRLDWTRNASLKREHGLDRILALEFPEWAPVESIAKELAGLPGILFAEIDAWGRGAQIPPNDTHYTDQWDLKNTGQTGGLPGADVDAEGGWSLGTGSPSVVLAVADTGIDSAHPEFAGRIGPGYDFVNEDADPEGDSPHGTDVAGMALANANNALQVAGVDWAASQMPLKVIDENIMGVTSDLVDAIIYATDNGADVINMSLGMYPCSGSLRNAMQYAIAGGTVCVASAGNGGEGDADVSGPGCIPETISVGATDDRDRRASFSATGAQLDVVAPGYGARTVTYHNYSDGFSSFSGTSASAPIVSGIATLLRGLDPTLTPAELRALIESNADDQVGSPSEDLTGWDDRFGWGRVNMRESLAAALPATLRRGQALPRRSGVGQSATFSVVYTSAGEVPPDFVRLVLDGPESGTFTMTRSTGAHPVLVDGSFANGERYDVSVLLGSTGAYRYHFEAAALGVPARHPAAGELDGPAVTLILSEDVAISESSVASSFVAGNYRMTRVLDLDSEVLDEILSSGSPSQRYSTLDHRYTFIVSGGDAVTFFINASRVIFWPAEDDRYDAFYSTNGGASWTYMLTVSATDPGETYQTCAMPPGTSGEVLVRFEDTDSTPGNTGLDRLFIDHMFFRSEAGATPGEARDLRVTGIDPLTGNLSLAWTPACAGQDHNIVYGPLGGVASYAYTGQVCGVGAGGTYGAFNPGAGSFFFLAVGTDGASTEGSYGRDSAGLERPEQTNDPVCSFSRDLTHRCD